MLPVNLVGFIEDERCVWVALGARGLCSSPGWISSRIVQCNDQYFWVGMVFSQYICM